MAERASWLQRRVVRAWDRFLALFSHRRRFVLDVVEALERGEGVATFTWFWVPDDGEDDGDLAGLMADVDQAIRRAPAPLGADEFFVRVVVYGPRPGDQVRVEDCPRGRPLLRFESFFWDRYYDWKRGDAAHQLRALLAGCVPCPEAPLVIIQVMPLGGAVAALHRQGRWAPASPWMR